MGKIKEELQKVMDECYSIYENGGYGAVIDHVAEQQEKCNPDYMPVIDEHCTACDNNMPSLNHICLVCGQETEQPYFKIVEQGFNTELQREQIEINMGLKGKVFLIKTEEGIVIDVYSDNDLIDSIIAYNDEIGGDFTKEDVEAFLDKWGQTHEEITANLGYDEEGSDDLLTDDYFWLESQKKWYPESSSMYNEKEQDIADYLRGL